MIGILKDTGHQEGGSFLFFLREIPQAFGILKIQVKSKGQLYIDNVLRSEIEPGTMEIRNIAEGEHNVKLLYPDGLSEDETVEVKQDKPASISFKWITPGPARAGVKDKNRIQFVLKSSAGGVLPVFRPENRVADYTLGTRFAAGIIFPFEWGNLSVALAGGPSQCYGLQISDELQTDAESFLFEIAPAVLKADYQTNFHDVFYLYGGLEAGLAFVYLNWHSPRDDKSIMSYLLINGGTGLKFFNRIGIEVGLGFEILPFTGLPYFNLYLPYGGIFFLFW
jgi:hypothetical protein